MSIVLVYLDRKSNQIVRVNYNTRTTPANLDETYFVYHDTERMPKEIVAEKAWSKLEYVFQTGSFTIGNTPIDIPKIQRLNTMLDCIERLQGMVNVMRINKSINPMVGGTELQALYQRELEEYNTIGVAGPLLESRVNDTTTIEEVVADLMLKQDLYNDMLIRTEKILNYYLPKVKSSKSPYSILIEVGEKFGRQI